MIHKNLMLIVGLVVGLLVGIGMNVGADILHGANDDGDWFIIERPLPQEIMDVIDSLPEVLYTEVTTTTTLIQLNGTDFNVDNIANYLGNIEQVLDRNEIALTTFPNYELPDCKWDYGTNQKIGVYWFNGQPVVIQNDTRC